MSLMKTRRISPSDGILLRELHLRMYADSPDAFSESLATAQAMTAEQWDARARQLAGPAQAVAFVAMAGPEPIGFTAGFLGRWRDGAMHSDARDTVTLARAWVDPRHRHNGIGRTLAEAVKAWAVEQGAAPLEAQVTETNEPAIRFYAALRFTDTARREPLLSNPTLQIRFLSHPL